MHEKLDNLQCFFYYYFTLDKCFIIFYLKFGDDIDNVGGEWKIHACFAVIYMNWYVCQTFINIPARWTTNIPVAEILSNINPSGANPAWVRDLKFVNTVVADPLAPDVLVHQQTQCWI